MAGEYEVQPAIGLDIHRETGANLVEVHRRVLAEIDAINVLPEMEGIDIEVLFSQADGVVTSLTDLALSGLIGAMLSLIVLYIFLRQVTTTLVVMLAIPAALVAAPAAAQVNGIATVEPALVIAQSQALQTAYQQISTTYQAQRTQIEQLQQQRTALAQQLDTNNDGQLTDEEVATAQQNNAPAVQQIQGLDQQIAQVQAPMQLARIYVVEQVAAQYGAALEQVVNSNGITLILSPDAIVYGPNVDVTGDVATALNARVTSVASTPPEGWEPNRNSVQTFQQVQQVLMLAAMQQAQQQQEQQQQQPSQDGQVEGR